MALVASPTRRCAPSNSFSAKLHARDVLPDPHTYPDIDHIAASESLVVSPYDEPAHQLRLHTVDIQSQLLAKALTQMNVLRPDYATSAYAETFNWSDIISDLRKLTATTGISWTRQRWYVVVFRSQIPPTTDYGDLGALDKAAHAEGTASGGFLKYWFGAPDTEGRNLATCVWCSREHALKGGAGPAHREAAGAARHHYTDWKIERIALIVEDGIKDWSLVPWTDDE